MKSFVFKAVWSLDQWVNNVKISCNHEGEIIEFKPDSSIDPNIEWVDGFLLPGFQNAHSHAFQYAMAGLAERHSSAQSQKDDFWGWRETMYQIALQIAPEELESIATMLYAEMLRVGYTQVAEFHYLHHDKNGSPYNNIAEMGARLISAAKNAGIGITLVPMMYQKGGFNQAPNPRQVRFISKNLDQYHILLEASRAQTKNYSQANIGYGIHSLRAIDPSILTSFFTENYGKLPFHIHISEQLKEVEDAMNYLGARPVEWLLDNAPIQENSHLVHATHLNPLEVEAIAKAKARVVLCPTTEGNLGDGIFPLKAFQSHGGKWSIGTDSHVGLNPMEELRVLDYGQRLTTHNRKTFLGEGEMDAGKFAINTAWKAGRNAMGLQAELPFAIGAPLEGVVWDASNPLLACTSQSNLLSTMVYSTDTSALLGTITNGKWRVKNQKHQNEDIATSFIQAIKKIGIR